MVFQIVGARWPHWVQPFWTSRSIAIHGLCWIENVPVHPQDFNLDGPSTIWQLKLLTSGELRMTKWKLYVYSCRYIHLTGSFLGQRWDRSAGTKLFTTKCYPALDECDQGVVLYEPRRSPSVDQEIWGRIQSSLWGMLILFDHHILF